ncbi:hypothetical protein D9758_010347 [Tetrapyrgos nigripes]|uniref:Uncharacterized protein n=1 Tax=Tetrapyrgos nigripes TaxID=182062 RepID=A0A8H5CZI6_9AGAR|nr:hypothetical protein D9758_010347 [Tetrapyrgos nigripes]
MHTPIFRYDLICLMVTIMHFKCIPPLLFIVDLLLHPPSYCDLHILFLFIGCGSFFWYLPSLLAPSSHYRCPFHFVRVCGYTEPLIPKNPLSPFPFLHVESIFYCARFKRVDINHSFYACAELMTRHLQSANGAKLSVIGLNHVHLALVEENKPNVSGMLLSRGDNDKYVSRAEYDELKGRVDKLEALIARLTGAGSSSLSFEGYGRDDGGERSGGRSPDTGYGGMAAANMGRQRRGDGREEGGGESGVGSSRISGVGLAEATSAYGGYRGIGNEGRFPVAQSHGLDHQSPIGSRRSSSGGTSGSTVSGSGAGIGRLRSVSGIEDGGNPREASRGMSYTIQEY